jgi:hypothetical protein
MGRVYCRESILAIVIFPRQKIIYNDFVVLLACENVVKFLAVRQIGAWWPFASVMLIIRFPIMWLAVGWEPRSPPRNIWALGCLFKPAFWGLTLRHRKAVTWTCDQHTWFFFIYIAIITTPSFCNNTRSLEWAFFLFYPWCFFSGELPIALFQSSKELLFSSPFLNKNVVRVALYSAHWPPVWLPRLLSHLSSSRDSPMAFSFETLGLRWASALTDQPTTPQIISRTIWSEWTRSIWSPWPAAGCPLST